LWRLTPGTLVYECCPRRPWKRPGEGIELPAGGPWPFQSGPTDEPPFRVPFLFATNGRPYLKQVETQSGIWFRDARDPTNLRRALADWPSPEGLKAQLDIDRQAQHRHYAAAWEFLASCALTGRPRRRCDFYHHAASKITIETRNCQYDPLAWP